MDGDAAAASAEAAAAEPVSGSSEPASSTGEAAPGAAEPAAGSPVPATTGGLCAEDATELEGMFCCEDCGEVFSENAAFQEHQQHHQANPTGSSEPDGSALPENEGEAAHLCSVCSLSFVETSELHSHMEQMHGQPPPVASPPKNFQCPDCGKCYHKYGFLLNHMRLHDQAPKSINYDLEHLKTKSFNCETCGRSYSRASALDAHRRCHETNLFKSKPKVPRGKAHADPTADERPEVDLKKVKEEKTDDDSSFECTCGKSFGSQMGLKTHQRFSQNVLCAPEEKVVKTSPESTLYCADCRKFYKTKLAFLNHQRWHQNSSDSAKKFTCEECGKTFVLLENYFRHQRRHDIPEKSFQHQVCQVQKKQLECTRCGLKFSRASAFQAHQMQHADDADPEPTSRAPATLSMVKTLKFEREEKPCEEQHSLVVDDPTSVESDEEAQSYDLADFNVEVISDSEEEPTQDLNPDLELQCDSDQEGRESRMDLNIVQVDFEPKKEPCDDDAAGAEDEAGPYQCPDCPRSFARQVSLRVHRTWHRMYKNRGQTQGQSESDDTHDTAHPRLVEEHIESDLNSHVMNSDQTESRSLICNLCGKIFSRVSALVAHQLNHPKRKPYQCSGCMMSYSHEAALFKHMLSCSAKDRRVSVGNKKEYNPTKTLLGPKIYHCEECGKGFWSLGAYSHHKQNPKQCTDLRLRKGVSGHGNGSRSSTNVACPVCGRKFRHRGILSLHMRKHETGTHKCELCDRTFRLFSSLLRHQVVHSSQLPPPIKSFQHQVEQVKKNTYSCPDCGKLFSREKALQFHMKSHGYETGYSPSSPGSSVTLGDLQCRTCRMHFKSKALLRAHRKVCAKRQIVDRDESLADGSTGPREVQASGEKAETDSGQLQVEDLSLDRDLPQESAAALKYKCDQCNKSFSVVGALNLHKRIHTRARKFLSKAKPLAETSRPEVTSKRPYSCQECGREFVTNTALGSHKRWHAEKKARLMSDRKTENDVNMNVTSSPLESGFPSPGFGQNSFLAAHMAELHSRAAELDSEKADVDLLTSTPKGHQCPFCSLSFAKVRGLRAHKWQAHAAELRSLKDQTAPPEVLDQEMESEARKQLDFVHGNNFGLDVSQENQLPEAISDISSPTSRLAELSGKCFFKCADCGKGFQTEEHLRSHKVKAKSKPHCCALCCQSFWSGNQLQEHLAWHDEVRCRLPNEVRFRLSAALSTSPVKPNVLVDRKPCQNELGQSVLESS